MELTLSGSYSNPMKKEKSNVPEKKKKKSD